MSTVLPHRTWRSRRVSQLLEQDASLILINQFPMRRYSSILKNSPVLSFRLVQQDVPDTIARQPVFPMWIQVHHVIVVHYPRALRKQVYPTVHERSLFRPEAPHQIIPVCLRSEHPLPDGMALHVVQGTQRCLGIHEYASSISDYMRANRRGEKYRDRQDGTRNGNIE